DQDGDGLDAGQEALLGTSDLSADSDGDGTGEKAEVDAGTDPADPASFPAAVSGSIIYSGPQTGAVRIAANTHDALWPAENSVELESPGSYSITNLPTLSNYWLFAYIDKDGNRSNECWEAAGSYAANPLYLTESFSGADITVTNPPDQDADGMPDCWENTYNLNPQDNGDKLGDPDVDGLTNLEEFQQNTDPHNPDTDGDGQYDGGGFIHIKFDAVSLQPVSGGVAVNIACPDNYVNNLDIFARTDLVKGDWSLVHTTNANLTTHRTRWFDPQSASQKTRFYAAGNV
ncbi:MAG: hypothetical protein R6V03_00070, partial [Kiritimatiellia bacterium]